MTQLDRKGRLNLLLLFVIFFGPLLLAIVLYYGGEGWRPAGSTAHGTLLDPARPVPDVALVVDGQPENSRELFSGHWSLVMVAAGRCDANCQGHLYDLRQLRLRMAKDMDRVQRVFLYFGADPDPQLFSADQFAGTVTARIDSQPSEPLRNMLAALTPGDWRRAGSTYLIDPLGNAVLVYDANTPLGDIKKDLDLLLRVSEIG